MDWPRWGAMRKALGWTLKKPVRTYPRAKKTNTTLNKNTHCSRAAKSHTNISLAKRKMERPRSEERGRKENNKKIWS